MERILVDFTNVHVRLFWGFERSGPDSINFYLMKSLRRLRTAYC